MYSNSPSVSLTIVDTIHHSGASKVLQHSQQLLDRLVNLTQLYWYSDAPIDNVTLDCRLRWIKINPITQMPQDYNHVLLGLMPHVATEDYNIVIQTDGYPCNPEAWTDHFLQYDYVGAVWPWEMLSVGNGGFSMRSRRLLDALLKVNWQQWRDHPEDAVIARHMRQQLQQDYHIEFAPPHVADQFSIEWNMSSSWMGRSFGFHGQHSEIQLSYPQVK